MINFNSFLKINNIDKFNNDINSHKIALALFEDQYYTLDKIIDKPNQYLFDSKTGYIAHSSKIPKHSINKPVVKSIDTCECVEDIHHIFSSYRSYSTNYSLDIISYLSDKPKIANEVFKLLCENIAGSNKGIIKVKNIKRITTSKHYSKYLNIFLKDDKLRIINTDLNRDYLVYAIAPYMVFKGNMSAKDNCIEQWFNKGYD